MIAKETLKQLNQVYSKAHLEKGIFAFVKKFYLHKFFDHSKSPEVEQILNKIVSKKPVNSAETARISFSVFDHETIYKEFLATLPNTLQVLIEKMLWVESMKVEEVEKILNEAITLPPKYPSQQKELKSEFYFFSVVVQSYYTYPRVDSYILYLHPVFKQVLLKFYPKPANYYFIQLDEIPATHYRFTAESLVLHEIPKLLSYYMQGGIKYSGKGKPTEATLNKLQKAMQPAEFFAGEETLNKIRCMFMAGLLFDFKITNINIDTIYVIEDLFKKRYLKLYTSQFILMHLKGWAYMNDSDYNENAEHNFLEVLKQLPPGKWVSAENLVDFIQCRFITVKPVANWALGNRLYFDVNVKSTYGSYIEKKYAGVNGNKLVQLPFIKGSIFLFASFGLIEIAYEKVNTGELGKTFYSSYDELKYFRLTELGAYILGLASFYEPAEPQQKNKLQFSEDSLTILVEGDMSVLEILLSGFAERAGSSRFKVSHTHFLKDCKSKKDIDNKITLFKKNVNAKLPPFWEQQFRIWQDNALKIKADNDIYVFKIPTDAKELQRLIAQDAALKSMILKAEQFYVLVPSSQISRFKSRMKELGYLVE